MPRGTADAAHPGRAVQRADYVSEVRGRALFVAIGLPFEAVKQRSPAERGDLKHRAAAAYSPLCEHG